MIGLQGPVRIITKDEVLTAYRNGKVIFADGKPIDFEVISFQVTCNVQPVQGRELLLVPEGDRFKEQYWLFTNNNDKPLLDNDRISRNGVNFQVQDVFTWGSYQECRIMRIDVGPNKTP